MTIRQEESQNTTKSSSSESRSQYPIVFIQTISQKSNFGEKAVNIHASEYDANHSPIHQGSINRPIKVRNSSQLWNNLRLNDSKNTRKRSKKDLPGLSYSPGVFEHPNHSCTIHHTILHSHHQKPLKNMCDPYENKWARPLKYEEEKEEEKKRKRRRR